MLSRCPHHATASTARPRFFFFQAADGIRAATVTGVQTCALPISLWRAKYPGHPGLRISVNVSGVQLREPGFVEEVAQALAAAQLDGAGLTLEITETSLMESFD